MLCDFEHVITFSEPESITLDHAFSMEVRSGSLVGQGWGGKWKKSTLFMYKAQL